MRISPPTTKNGNASTSRLIYGFWPTSLGRIHSYNPSAKLIFLFRDPLDCAWSHWCMEYARGKEALSFAEAIRAGRSRLVGAPPLSQIQRVYSYMERGLYAEQVRRALDLFPCRQVLFLRSQDLLNNHHGRLARIADFLEISPFPETVPKRERRQPDFPFGGEIHKERSGGFRRSCSRRRARLFGSDGLYVGGWTTMKEA